MNNQIKDNSVSRRQVLKYLGAGVGGAALLGLAACSTGGGGSTSTPTGGAGDPTTDTPAETPAATNFNFAGWSLSEDAAKPVLQAQLAQFAGEHGINISEVSYPYGEYLNQLTLQVRGGQFSGAAQLDIAWLGTLAAMGKLRDLSSYTTGRGYSQAALDAGKFDGIQYGLPWTMGAIGLIANSDLLGQVGADNLPNTIEDFEALLRELKNLGGGVIPYAASTKVGQLKDIQVWMQTFGSPLLENGKITIGDEASVAAVTWYKKLLDEGLIAADVDRFDARSLFSQGRAAMYDDAPVGRAGVVNDSPDADLGSKMIPASRPVLNAGDTPRALAWGHTVVVVDGEGADTAADYAQWLTSEEEVVTAYFKSLGLPPTTDSGLANSAVSSDKFIADFSSRITATASPSPFWVYPQYGQIDSIINERVQAALVGQQDVASALADAAAEAQALIES